MKKPLPIALSLLLVIPLAHASKESMVTSVFSRTYNGYTRPKAADGSFSREYYALAKGTFEPGITVDRSIDRVKFPEVAGLAAQFLTLRDYHLAHDSQQAGLLLMITWGTTIPFNDGAYRANLDSFLAAMNQAAAQREGPAGRFFGSSGATGMGGAGDLEGELIKMKMFEAMRRDANQHNAQLLGYVDEINRGDTPARFAGLGTIYDDLISDIESERYYFVISAFDFKAAKEGKRRLLWATRVSVQAQGNKFNEAAAFMMAKASKYFGEDSGRLIRQYESEGKVHLGDLKYVGIVADPTASAPSEEEK